MVQALMARSSCSWATGMSQRPSHLSSGSKMTWRWEDSLSGWIKKALPQVLWIQYAKQYHIRVDESSKTIFDSVATANGFCVILQIAQTIQFRHLYDSSLYVSCSLGREALYFACNMAINPIKALYSKYGIIVNYYRQHVQVKCEKYTEFWRILLRWPNVAQLLRSSWMT